MIPHRSNLIIACVVIAFVALYDISAKEACAQTGPGRSLQTKTASRVARSQAKVENEKARPLMEEGLRRAEQKDWAGAFEAFNQALALSPRYSEVYIAMGDTYMNMGKYKEGFNAYQAAISVAPSNPAAHYSLGAAYNDMAQYGDAFKHFVQAIRLDSNFAEAHYGIGYAYLRIDRFKDALSYLRRAAQLWPDSVEVHLALGQAYIGLRDVKAAEKELKILAGLDASIAARLEKELSAISDIAQSAERLERDVVKPSAAQAPTPASGLNQRHTAPRNDSDLAVELSFWESVKNSAIPEEFAAYLNKYPAGQFAELARIRLRALAGKEELKEQPAPLITRTEETSEAASPTTLETTLDSLRQFLPSAFAYQTSTNKESPVDVKVYYEPLKFEGCTVKWRDGNDTLWVALSDLDPEAVKVEPRNKPETVFSIEVWNVSITAIDGKEVINEAKGDGSNTVNRYDGLDLQYDRREKAEKLAGALRQAIKLCREKPALTAFCDLSLLACD